MSLLSLLITSFAVSAGVVQEQSESSIWKYGAVGMLPGYSMYSPVDDADQNKVKEAIKANFRRPPEFVCTDKHGLVNVDMKKLVGKLTDPLSVCWNNRRQGQANERSHIFPSKWTYACELVDYEADLFLAAVFENIASPRRNMRVSFLDFEGNKAVECKRAKRADPVLPPEEESGVSYRLMPRCETTADPLVCEYYRRQRGGWTP